MKARECTRYPSDVACDRAGFNTARRYVKELSDSGKIYGDDKKRNRVYSFYDLIDIL